MSTFNGITNPNALTNSNSYSNNSISGVDLFINQVYKDFFKIFCANQEYTPFFNNEKEFLKKFPHQVVKLFPFDGLVLKSLQFIGYLRLGEILSPAIFPPKLFIYEKNFCCFYNSKNSLFKFQASFDPIKCHNFLLSLPGNEKNLELFIDLFNDYLPEKESPAKNIAFIRWKSLIKYLEPKLHVLLDPFNSLKTFCLQNQNDKIKRFGTILQSLIDPIQMNSTKQKIEFYYGLACLLIEEGISHKALTIDCLLMLSENIQEPLKDFLKQLSTVFTQTTEKEDARGKSIIYIINFLLEKEEFPEKANLAKLLFENAQGKLILDPFDLAQIEERIRKIDCAEFNSLFFEKNEGQKQLNPIRVQRNIITASSSDPLLFFEKKFLEILLKKENRISINNTFTNCTKSYCHAIQRVLRITLVNNLSLFRSFLFVSWNVEKFLKIPLDRSSNSYIQTISFIRSSPLENIGEIIKNYPENYAEDICKQFQEDLKNDYENKIYAVLFQLTDRNTALKETINDFKGLLEKGKQYGLKVTANLENDLQKKIDDALKNIWSVQTQKEELIIQFCSLYSTYFYILFSEKKAAKYLQMARNLFSKNTTATLFNLGISFLKNFFQEPIFSYEGSKEEKFKSFLVDLQHNAYPLAWKILNNADIKPYVGFITEEFRVKVIQKFCREGLNKNPITSMKIISEYLTDANNIAALPIIIELLGYSCCSEFYSVIIDFMGKFSHGNEKILQTFRLFAKKLIESNEILYLLDLFSRRPDLLNLKEKVDISLLTTLCQNLIPHLRAKGSVEIFEKIHKILSWKNTNFSLLSNACMLDFYPFLFEIALHYKKFDEAENYLSNMKSEIIIRLLSENNFKEYITYLKSSEQFCSLFYCLMNTNSPIKENLVFKDAMFIFTAIYVREGCTNRQAWNIIFQIYKKHEINFEYRKEELENLLSCYFKPAKNFPYKSYANIIELFSISNENLIKQMLNECNSLKEDKRKFLEALFRNEEIKKSESICQILYPLLIESSSTEFFDYVLTQDAEPFLVQLPIKTKEELIEKLFVLKVNIDYLGKICKLILKSNTYSKKIIWQTFNKINQLIKVSFRELIELKPQFDQFDFFFKNPTVLKLFLEEAIDKYQEKAMEVLPNLDSLHLIFLLHNNENNVLNLVEKILQEFSANQHIFYRVETYIQLLEKFPGCEKLFEIIWKINILNELKKPDIKKLIANVIALKEPMQLDFSNCAFASIFSDFIKSHNNFSQINFEYLSIELDYIESTTNIYITKVETKKMEFLCFIVVYIHKSLKLWDFEDIVNRRQYIETFLLIKEYLDPKFFKKTLFLLSPLDYWESKEIAQQEKISYISSIFEKLEIIKKEKRSQKKDLACIISDLYKRILYLFTNVNAILDYFDNLQIYRFIKLIKEIEEIIESELKQTKNGCRISGLIKNKDYSYVYQDKFNKLISITNNFLIKILNQPMKNIEKEIIAGIAYDFCKTHLKFIKIYFPSENFGNAKEAISSLLQLIEGLFSCFFHKQKDFYEDFLSFIHENGKYLEPYLEKIEMIIKKAGDITTDGTVVVKNFNHTSNKDS